MWRVDGFGLSMRSIGEGSDKRENTWKSTDEMFGIKKTKRDANFGRSIVSA
jgi:hypothetical protein